MKEQQNSNIIELILHIFFAAIFGGFIIYTTNIFGYEINTLMNALLASAGLCVTYIAFCPHMLSWISGKNIKQIASSFVLGGVIFLGNIIGITLLKYIFINGQLIDINLLNNYSARLDLLSPFGYFIKSILIGCLFGGIFSISMPKWISVIIGSCLYYFGLDDAFRMYCLTNLFDIQALGIIIPALCGNLIGVCAYNIFGGSLPDYMKKVNHYIEQ